MNSIQQLLAMSKPMVVPQSMTIRPTLPAFFWAHAGLPGAVGPAGIDDDFSNRSIVYIGFIRIDETVTIVKAAGAGSLGALVPGTEIEFTITYTLEAGQSGVFKFRRRIEYCSLDWSI